MNHDREKFSAAVGCSSEGTRRSTEERMSSNQATSRRHRWLRCLRTDHAEIIDLYIVSGSDLLRPSTKTGDVVFDVELHVRLGQRRFGIRFFSGLGEGEANEHKPAMYGRAKQ